MSDSASDSKMEESVVVAQMKKAGVLKTKEAVISLFNRISQEVEIFCDYQQKPVGDNAFAATEILVYAVEKELLDWTKLKAIVEKTYSYDVAYSVFSKNLWGNIESADYEYDTREDYFLFCRLCGKADEYIAYVDALVEAWNEKSKKYSIAPKKSLKWKSPTYWENYAYHQSAQIPTRASVSTAYELRLLEEKDFVEELRQFPAKVSAFIECSWRYNFDGNGIEIKDFEWDDGKILRFTNKSGDPLREEFRQFCLKWCLESVSVGYSTGKTDEIDFRAMRVVVKPDDENIGIRVFIPRYFRFSHIENYQDDDFGPLKIGMNEIFESFQIPRKRKITLKDLKATAKRVRQECTLQGYSRHDAWEAARKAVGWEPGRMTKFMGKQPEIKKGAKQIPYRKRHQPIPFGDAPEVI